VKVARIVFVLCLALLTSGCLLTKALSVPMRLGAAAISVLPVAGNPAHDAIDEAAAAVDDLPF